MTSRREAIVTQPNPVRRLDFVVGFEAPVRTPGGAHAVELALRYVPDRWIADADTWTVYLAKLAEASWPTLEELAGAILDDANNQLVPRWLGLELRAPAAAGLTTRVVMEDQQPNWQNADLLSRIRYT